MQKSLGSLFIVLHTCLSVCAMIRSPSTGSIIVDRAGIGDFLTTGIVETFQVPSKICPLDNGALHIFPFNVGQANFVVMRRGNECVIIDAGTSGSAAPQEVLEPSILDVFAKTTIKAVFLTHPHDDHYNLFSSKQSFFSDQMKDNILSSATFILGGTSTDWDSTKAKGFLNQAKNKLFYDDPALLKDLSANNIMTGVSFRIFGLTPPASGDNKLSLLIHASFMDKNVLFTGDAEGDSIDRLQGMVCNLKQLSDLYKLRVSMTGTVPAFIGKIDELYKKIDGKVTEQLMSHSLFDVKTISVEICKEYWDTFFSIPDSLVPTENDVIANYLLRFTQDPALFAPVFQQTFLEYLSALIKSIDEKNLDDDNKDRIRTAISLLSEEALKKHMKSDLKVFYQCYLPLGLGDKSALEEDKVKQLKECLEKFSKELSVAIALEACNSTDFMSEQKLEIYSTTAFLNLLTKDHKLAAYKTLLCEYLNNMLRRRIFADSHLIFVPHHGTRTENSQRFLGFFSGIAGERAYIVSSSPFGKHHLPKRSTLEMSPLLPVHPRHPFIYYEDFTNIGGKAALQMTMKPIYVTGAAPGGYYFLSIVADFISSSTSSSSSSKDTASIYMFDPYNRGKGSAEGWFNVLTGKYK